MPSGLSVSVRTDPAADGFSNMARDIALFAGAEGGRPGCRLYSWDGPWVSLGRFQRPEDALVDLERTRWVMRPTGGKAVLHGHDLTVGLALPLASIGDQGRLSRSIKTVYTLVAQPIVQSLRGCGLPAILAAETPFANRGRRVADCFAHVSPNDIVDERTGLKVCGCALQLSRSAVLVQASIPAGQPLVEPASVIPLAQPVNFDWDPTEFGPRLERALGEFVG